MQPTKAPLQSPQAIPVSDRFHTSPIAVPSDIPIGFTFGISDLEDNYKYIFKIVLIQKEQLIHLFWLGKMSKDTAKYFRSVYELDRLNAEDKMMLRKYWQAALVKDTIAELALTEGEF